ncbi:M61 family metallopeptidase [Aestuariibaculum suncheonense]|uniref:M61 family metallopeptidase n=1 Tax=Aestuariibaculum suncheonense TaxID=1028745 RepID=A0A8J6UI96_9FLAO|nr:PDZ domain-containing protein [Aestuariibaculum suncheonense]MBD0833956.1 M61 family metallopeptidase [Aestuariibaculum suncheonense]
MRRILFVFLFVFSSLSITAQVASTYTISFENAAHHEAVVEADFTNLKEKTVEFRMSRTSPGRYALHEFMKNIYDVKVTDGKGNALKTSRPDPYSWTVSEHDGTIKVKYILFANRGGGTYSQIDDTHAHLNMPATFIYVPELEDKPMEVTFKVREDLNWKVATQLKHVEGHTYYAKNLQYFMDSPTEVSHFSKRSFQVNGQTIHFVLHHNGTEAELDEYFSRVKKIVLEEEQVYGELPKFDYGEYTFLVCYIPNASGDGMEHRNSTIVTNTRSLADGGMDSNLGTVAHEFFHCWNVERIRPDALEPFNFEETNMSGELWFAEGFTSYYTNLTLCRAGLMSEEKYVKSITGTFNYVWNSPARQFFNPIEMSYQAPFVDAARSVDPVNRDNTFISYYSYGNMLGLALDLSLRQNGLNLDDYMKLVWKKYGKQEKPYTVEDLHNTLNEYAGETFGSHFFKNYIYKSGMPDMKMLLNSVGVSLTQNLDKPDFGGPVNDEGFISKNTIIGTAAYNAGLEEGDKILKVIGTDFTSSNDFNALINSLKPNDIITIEYERFGLPKQTKVTLLPNTTYSLNLFEINNQKLSVKQKAARKAWLGSKQK